jgi:hypothetical protein
MKKTTLLAFFSYFVSLGIVAVAVDPTTNATFKNDAQQAASKALVAEADGDFVGRQRLLREAEWLDRDCALAKSQKSELRIADDWLTVAQCVARFEKNPIIPEYERLRGTNELNVEQHFLLAQWCQQRQLMLQAYGHLNRVIQLDSNHAPALRALGYQQVGTEWISPAQLRVAQLRANRTRAAMAQFGKQVQEIGRSLVNPRATVSKGAVAMLNDIDDPAAVPAVESILSTSDSKISTLVVNWMSGIDSSETSQVLTRYAMFHPDAQIRRHASESLKIRPLHDFVPSLIELTVSPVAEMLVPVFSADGTLSGYRQAFAQEEAERNNLLVVDTTYSRFTVAAAINAPSEGDDSVVRVGSSDVDAANRRIERAVTSTAANESMSRKLDVQQTNATILARNIRIAELLSDVTGEEIQARPDEIWRWWDKQNESNTQLSKAIKFRRSNVSRAVPRYEAYAFTSNRASMGPSGSADSSNSGGVGSSPLGSFFFAGGFLPPIPSECFVAGTPVMTHKGLLSIERIRTGDLVLSRDLETGSLAWKPVVAATQRSPELTKEIQTASQTMRCTGGHLFWVSGKGWEKASDLKPGDVLHCASEPTVVMSVKTMPAAPTYNLGVADNANYFVGKEMVLSHDVTKRESTRMRVPGLQELAAQPTK